MISTTYSSTSRNGSPESVHSFLAATEVAGDRADAWVDVRFPTRGYHLSGWGNADNVEVRISAAGFSPAERLALVRAGFRPEYSTGFRGLRSRERAIIRRRTHTSRRHAHREVRA